MMATMMLTMVLIADDEDDAEDNDNTVVNDNVQSAGSQGSSSTVPGLKAHPGAQGLLHWGQGEHHQHLHYHKQELCYRGLGSSPLSPIAKLLSKRVLFC